MTCVLARPAHRRVAYSCVRDGCPSAARRREIRNAPSKTPAAIIESNRGFIIMSLLFLGYGQVEGESFLLPVHVEEYLLWNLVSGSKKSIWTELFALDVKAGHVRRWGGNKLNNWCVCPTPQELALLVRVERI